MRSSLLDRARILLVALVGALSACATTAPPPTKTAAASPKSSDAIPDALEQCPAIPDTCGTTDGEDGCPAPFFRIGDGCLTGPRDQEDIDRAAAQMLGNPRIDVVEIVSSDQACAYRFVSRLVRAGVAPTRLRVRLDREVTGLTWWIALFDEKPC